MAYFPKRPYRKNPLRLYPLFPYASTMNDEMKRLLNYFEQAYLLNAQYPTKEKVSEFGITSKTYEAALKNADFLEALERRGLPNPVTDIYQGVLSPLQLAVANALLDLHDNRSQRKKLQEFGVTTAKYNAWLRDPAFKTYLQRRAENFLGDNQHEAHLALVDRVKSGDVGAIKYYNEMTGRFTPSSAKAPVDINAVLMAVLEAIQRRITDPQLLSELSDDLLAIAHRTSAIPSPVGVGAIPVQRVVQGSLALKLDEHPVLEGEI